jgi:hypothetical protein
MKHRNWPSWSPTYSLRDFITWLCDRAERKALRRLLIFALAMCVAQLGPIPLSACALFSSKLVECLTPKTQCHCEECGTKLAAMPGTCWNSASLPPESQFETPEISQLAIPAVVIDATWKLPRVEDGRPDDVVQDLSPPPIRSLLCTFLI